MLTNVSCFDFNSSSKESHYHVFILGMMLGLRRKYHVHSNKESGRGRYDLIIEPRDKSKYKSGLVIEFKLAQDESDLVRASEEALTQIENKKYDVELRDRGVEKIILVGMSFYQRDFKVIGKILEK